MWESPDGSGRQYAFQVAGSNDERLVVLFEGQEVDVDWLGKYSPDGARLLALEYGDDGYDLIVLDLRVGTATTVAANTRACGCGGSGSRWLWSPSGRYVLHDHLDDQDGHSSVDLIDTTTNTTTTLIEGEGFSTGEWFPFSDMLLLQSARDGVWLVDVESGVSTIIEATPVARIDSRGQFVYWTKQLTAGESEIVVRELKTGATVSWPGEIINVFPPAAAVVWTSDGPAGQVRHIDCNGVVAHHPALPAGGRCVARVDVGAWSPDGLLFAYTRIERTGGGPSWSVYILDPASGQETMLAKGLGRGGEIAPVPMWNRQGTHIVVTWPGESPL